MRKREGVGTIDKFFILDWEQRVVRGSKAKDKVKYVLPKLVHFEVFEHSPTLSSGWGSGVSSPPVTYRRADILTYLI